MKHWSSANAHSYKRDKRAVVRPKEDGEVEVRGTGKADYYHPKTVHECYQAAMNWRSAMSRLWPWSWESEVFCRYFEFIFFVGCNNNTYLFFRLLDEYGWLQFAQSKGTKIRVQLIEKIFEDASFANARDPRALPLNYTELKQLLADILVGAGIPNLTPVSSLAFGESEFYDYVGFEI